MSVSSHNKAVRELLAQLWRHLTPKRRTQFVLLTGLMFMSAVAELVSLGAVFPFLGVLIAPQRIFSNRFAAHMAEALHISSSDALILPLTIAFATVAVL